MKRDRVVVCFVFALGLLGGPAFAAAPQMVADLNPNLAYVINPAPEDLGVFRGQAVFTLLEAFRGRTMWTSDGTPAGTRRLAEGLDAVTAILGEASGGLLVVAARDFQQPRPELWRVDLSGGSERLAGGASPLGRTFFPFGGDFYFFATPRARSSRLNFPPSATSLWRTDGTAAGTREVAAVGPSHFTVGPVVFQGRLYFLVGERGEYEPEVRLSLWVSDGRAAGTRMITALESTSNEIFLLQAGRRLVFSGETRRGEELWGSDGTAAGTFPLTDFAAERPLLGSTRAVAAAGRVYFVADDGDRGRELWSSDGTGRGTLRLTDLAPADPFASDGYGSVAIAAAGGGVLFAADDGVFGLELWRSAGTPASTGLVSDLCFGACSGFVAPGSVQEGRLFFLGRDAVLGLEPRVSDGTAAGTVALADLCPGSCDSSASFTTLGGSVVLLDRPTEASFALYATDGSSSGTELLLAADLALMSTSPQPVARLGRRLVFFATGPENPAELWTATLPLGPARPVTGFTRPVPAGSQPVDFTAAGDQVFFVGCDGRNATLFRTHGEGASALLDLENDCVNFFNSFVDEALLSAVGARAYLAYLDLWVSDGTPTGTINLTRFDWRPTGFPIVFSNVAELDGRAAFVVLESLEGQRYHERLWLSDGTPEGTHPTDALPQPLAVFELFSALGRLFFWASDDHGIGFWSSDGTAAGTHLLHRLPVFVQPPDEAPVEALGGVIFTTGGPQFSLGLWRTDGTPEGTEELTGLVPEPVRGKAAENLGVFAGALFFVAGTGSGEAIESELWRTDGTALGTERLGPLGLSFVDSVAGPVEVGDKLLYLRSDYEAAQVWASDGTAAGTGPVGPTLGPALSGAGEWVAAGGRAFFSAFEREHGWELWQSDGTPAGTRLAADIAPGRASSLPGGLAAAGSDLYFCAYPDGEDFSFGRQPWRLPAAAGSPDCAPSPFALCLAGGRVQATLTWHDEAGLLHRAEARPLATASGGFSFTEPANLEVVVKAVDATAINGHLWAFAGSLTGAAWDLTFRDGATGGARRWVNLPRQQTAALDLEAFPAHGLPPAAGVVRVLEGSSTAEPRSGPFVLSPELEGAPPCEPAPGVLCLLGGRFRVEVGHEGSPFPATVLPWSDLAGAFTLAPSANADLAVKILDATAFGGHFWVFGTSLTPRPYTVTVTDTATGTRRSYTKPQGVLVGFADFGSF